MEGIDLAGVVDSDFQGIQINFAPPRPAGFANFHGAGRGGARLAFLRGGAGRGSPFFAGRGGAGRGAHPWFLHNPLVAKTDVIKSNKTFIMQRTRICILI